MHVKEINKYSIPAFERLLPMDEEECRAQGFLPYEAVALSVERSFNSWVFMDDEEVVLFGGFKPLNPLHPVVQVWWLGTPLARRHAVSVVKIARNAMRMMLESYSTILVVVDIQHEDALRLLDYLGFVPASPAARFVTFAASRETIKWAL